MPKASLTIEISRKWNALVHKILIGKDVTVTHADREWLCRIGSAAVGFHELAVAATVLARRLDALLPAEAEERALRVKLAEYGYLEPPAAPEADTHE